MGRGWRRGRCRSCWSSTPSSRRLSRRWEASRDSSREVTWTDRWAAQCMMNNFQTCILRLIRPRWLNSTSRCRVWSTPGCWSRWAAWPGSRRWWTRWGAPGARGERRTWPAWRRWWSRWAEGGEAGDLNNAMKQPRALVNTHIVMRLRSILSLFLVCYVTVLPLVLWYWSTALLWNILFSQYLFRFAV